MKGNVEGAKGLLMDKNKASKAAETVTETREQKKLSGRELTDRILLELRGVSKSFETTDVLQDMNLKIEKNTFVTILGPSGCGKSTTLRLIAGFEKPDSGSIFFEGKDITGLPPERREVNTVFQNYALFTHMSVAENIAFGLKLKKYPKEYIADRVDYALSLVNLEGYGDRNPASLSGGQQQRIAIARAIVNEPKILLLDEPLGALDLKLRKSMQIELMKLKEELGITFVYVTHDQEEALTMSDQIVVMNHGVIEQIGSAEDIYNEPKNAYVARFIGEANLKTGNMISAAAVSIEDMEFPCTDEGFLPGTPVDVMIRPEDVELVSPADGQVTGVVSEIIFKGIFYHITVQCGKNEWKAASTMPTPVGTEVGIHVDPFNIRNMIRQ